MVVPRLACGASLRNYLDLTVELKSYIGKSIVHCYCGLAGLSQVIFLASIYRPAKTHWCPHYILDSKGNDWLIHLYLTMTSKLSNEKKDQNKVCSLVWVSDVATMLNSDRSRHLTSPNRHLSLWNSTPFPACSTWECGFPTAALYCRLRFKSDIRTMLSQSNARDTWKTNFVKRSKIRH